MEAPPVDIGSMPRRTVDVGGFRIHMWSDGTGAPPVVMEAGTWDMALTWAWVLPNLATFTNAIAYDRAGVGWSDPSPRARTAAAMVDELITLLDATDVDPPYVLVGMSFGGLIAKLLAYRHPDRVAGLVFVDAAHEDQFIRAPDEIRDALGPMTAMQLEQLRQLIGLTSGGQREQVKAMLPIDPSLPPSVAAVYRDLMSSETSLRAMLDEMEHLEESQEQVRAARKPTVGDIPLIAIRHAEMSSLAGMGISESAITDYEQTWQELQEELAALSPRGRVVVAPQGGHAVHQDQPDLVVEAIREVVEAVRSSQ